MLMKMPMLDNSCDFKIGESFVVLENIRLYADPAGGRWNPVGGMKSGDIVQLVEMRFIQEKNDVSRWFRFLAGLQLGWCGWHASGGWHLYLERLVIPGNDT